MTVYERMIEIIGELPAIGKTQQNREQGFMFRGHDDVMNALNPLLAKHGVFIVPDVIERVVSTRQTSRGSTMYEVNLHVRFTFYGVEGDSFVASGWGEGTDMGDKATNKAMTGAFKYVVAQTFALATAEASDADASSPEETTRTGPTTDTAPTSREGRQRSAQAVEFNPARDLLPTAIKVTNEEDATALQLAQRDLLPDHNWVEEWKRMMQHLFGKTEAELTPAQWGEWWKRLANAIVKAQDLSGSADFVEPHHVAQAYAWAFNGHELEEGGSDDA